MINRLLRFRKHLEGQVTAPSGTVYASLVRRFLDRHQMTPTADQVLAYDAELETRNRGPFRAAWRHYMQYCKSDGVECPEVIFRRHKATYITAAEEPKHELQAEILFLLHEKRIKPAAIARMLWKDVEGGVEGAYIKDPKNGMVYVIPMATAKKIRAWATPTATLAPFIPKQPGSLEPMSATRLQNAATSHRS